MNNPTVIGIYGKSNTGKTMLLTKIVKELNLETFKIATVKITDKKIGIDKKGKDTEKHSRAGADLVVFSTNSETDYLIKKKSSIQDIIQNILSLGDFDLILIEGANDKETLKIRIGNADERPNTKLTFDDNFEEIIKFIKSQISMGKIWKKQC